MGVSRIRNMKKARLEMGTVYKANGNNSLAVIIPKSVKESLGIEQGTRFLISAEDGTITLKIT